MRMGVNLGYWGRGTSGPDQVAIAIAADRLGYDSVWVAEAYGSDSPSMLAWIGALTEHVALGRPSCRSPVAPPR